MLGYVETKKGYRLFDLEINTFLISGDVSFRETIFPFKGARKDLDDIFYPVSSEIIYEGKPLSTLTEEQVIQDVCDSHNLIENENATTRETPDDLKSKFNEVNDLDLVIDRTVLTEEVITQDEIIDSEARRSSIRTSRPSIWMKNYKLIKKRANQISLFPISKYISYS